MCVLQPARGWGVLAGAGESSQLPFWVCTRLWFSQRRQETNCGCHLSNIPQVSLAQVCASHPALQHQARKSKVRRILTDPVLVAPVSGPAPAAKAAPAHIPSQNFPKLQGGGTNLGQASAWWRKLLFSIHLWGMQGQIPFTPSQRLSVSAGLHKPGHKASADTETELKRLLIAFYPPLILN